MKICVKFIYWGQAEYLPTFRPPPPPPQPSTSILKPEFKHRACVSDLCKLSNWSINYTILFLLQWDSSPQWNFWGGLRSWPKKWSSHFQTSISTLTTTPPPLPTPQLNLTENLPPYINDREIFVVTLYGADWTDRPNSGLELRICWSKDAICEHFRRRTVISADIFPFDEENMTSKLTILNQTKIIRVSVKTPISCQKMPNTSSQMILNLQ